MRKMLGLIKKIPRVVYYMKPTTAIGSMYQLILGKSLYCQSSMKFIAQFEAAFARYVGCKHAYVLSHARICFHYYLKYQRAGPRQIVLLTPVNIPDMFNIIKINGMTPHLIDFDDNSYYPPISKLETHFSNNQVACFLLTILNGVIPNLEIYQSVCRKFDVKFIVDATQSCGAKCNQQALVSYCDVAIYSTCDLKTIHTHMGGVLCTNDKKTVDAIRAISLNDLRPISFSYFQQFIIEDFIATVCLNRFVFSLIIYPMLGLLQKTKRDTVMKLFNGDGLSIGGITFLKDFFGRSGKFLRTELPQKMRYRFTGIQAKIGLEALSDVEIIDGLRARNALLFLSRASEAIKSKLINEIENKDNTYWKIALQVPDVGKLQCYLLKHGIDSSISLLPCLCEIFGDNPNATPNAVRVWKHSLNIPLHYYLNVEEVYFVANTVNAFFENHRAE